MRTQKLKITRVVVLDVHDNISENKLLPTDTLEHGQHLSVVHDGNFECYLALDINKVDVAFCLISFLRKQRNFFSKEVSVELPKNLTPTNYKSLKIAWNLSDYEIGLFREKEDHKTIKYKFEDHHSTFDFLDNQALKIAEAKKRMMDLVNMPGNKLNSLYWHEYMQTSAKKHGYELKLYLGKEEVEKLGFTGLLAVNRGSEWPPLFAYAKHIAGKDHKRIALVGKGVTFDTGGLSIKGSQNMHYMKSDMGGAAAALGAFEALVSMDFQLNIDLFLPITDNCVDANAIKPGDIIEAYGGKTIEVINTDAEGRLILADALSYATETDHYDVVIDLATLTGSTVRTFANYAAAMFTKNDLLKKQMEEAAEISKELVWPMPLWDSYAQHLHSDVADISNLGNIPAAGAITAAKFLEFFTHEHPAWIHLDIPAMAFGKTPFGKEKAATAYGVELLVSWVEQFVQN